MRPVLLKIVVGLTQAVHRDQVAWLMGDDVFYTRSEGAKPEKGGDHAPLGGQVGVSVQPKPVVDCDQAVA